MKTLNRLVGILIVVGVVYYVYALRTQTGNIKMLCNAYSEGRRLDDPAKLAREYSVQLMGPIEVEESPESTRLIYCAPLTMCDDSCTLDVKDGIVIRKSYTSH